MKTFCVCILLAFTGSYAVADELRQQVIEEMKRPYEECRQKIYSRSYEKEFAAYQQDSARDHSRCSHDAERKAGTKRVGEPDPAAECSSLKPSREQLKEALQNARNGI